MFKNHSSVLNSSRAKSRRGHLLALASAQVLCLAASSADTVAYWNFNALSIAAPSTPGSGGVPTILPADQGTGSLSLASWLGMVEDFGGSTINAQGGALAEESLSVIAGGTTAPFPGNNSFIELAVSFTGLRDPVVTFATRGTSSGFSSGTWSYKIAGGSFVPVSDINSATTSTTFALATVDLSSYNELDGASDVTLRYTLNGATSSSGNNRIDNLLVSATASGPDTTPPSPTALSPADNATDVVAASVTQLSIVFSEDIVLGTGNIVVRKASDNSPVNSIDVSDFGQVDLNGNILGLPLVNPLAAGTAYYVEIPATAVRDAANNPYPGITGNTGWNFTTAPPPTPPTVVVNKYSNASLETIELLVIDDELSASSLDMRGMIVKDFASNMGSDGGGKFEFAANALWEAVPVGTLVVLENSATSSDTDDSDFVIRVGLSDPAYFTSLGGSFDISATDMIMVKAAGSSAAGTTGGIHVLGGGVAGSLFSGFSGAKVLADTGGAGVIATNPTSTLADFIGGTKATGGVTLTPANFGLPNTGGNSGYIALLRGTNPSTGDGTASLVNVTPASPFFEKGIFGRGLGAQSARVTINALVPSVTLTDITVTVPAAFGTPGAVTLSGAGSTGASSVVAGQTVTISAAAATTANPLVVTIDGLSTPTPSALAENGNYPFTIATKGSGGTLAPIGLPPAARVLVPIEVLRDIDANGIALDAGSIVALEGVCTMDNFSATNTQAYLQDSTAGINLFSTALIATPLSTGRRYAVLGTVQQFSGLTEIVPLAESDIIDLGPGVLPAAEVLTIPTLLAAAEESEGSLVKLQNLYKVSGTWATGQNVVLRDSANNLVTVRLQPASTALPEPAYPLIVTGILTQFDGSNPFTSGYQLLPRIPGDLEAGTVSDFESWTTATGATGGMTGDTDFDGKTNEFEYAFGLNPVSGGSVDPFVAPFSPATGKFTYSRRKPALTKLGYRYEYSTNLGAVWGTFVSAVPEVSNNGDPVETITVEVPAALLDEPRLFIRVAAE